MIKKELCKSHRDWHSVKMDEQVTLSENFNVNDFDLLKVGDETKKWCPNISYFCCILVEFMQ